MRNSDSQVVYDALNDKFIDDAGHEYTELTRSARILNLLSFAEIALKRVGKELVVDFRDEDAKFGGKAKIYFRVADKD